MHKVTNILHSSMLKWLWNGQWCSFHSLTKEYPVDPTQERIDQLDLTMVKRKLMEAFPEGRGWSADQAEMAEKWYKRYLSLCAIYPAEAVVPNYPIDTIWHQHILDTAAYADDCQRIFGHFLHHFPYFELRGEDDRKHRDSSFDTTNELYLKHFGEDCRNMAGFEEQDAVTCGRGCGNGTGCARKYQPNADSTMALSCKGGGSGGGGGCSRNISEHALSCKGGGSGGGGGCSRNIEQVLQ